MDRLIGLNGRNAVAADYGGHIAGPETAAELVELHGGGDAELRADNEHIVARVVAVDLLHRGNESVLAALTGGVFLPALGEKHRPRIALLFEMRHEIVERLFLLDRDDVEAVIADIAVAQHNRQAAARHADKMVILAGRGVDQQPRNALGDEHVDELLFLLQAVVAVGKDRNIAALRQIVPDGDDQRR